MTIIKRGNSYWVDIGFNHKRYRKRSPDNSFKGAKAYEVLIRHKLARGEPIEEPKEIPKAKFKELALQWLEVYVKNNNKPSEYRNKKNILNDTLIPYFGNKTIELISTHHIEQYKSYLLTERKLAPKSVNNYLSILSGCLKSSVEIGIIQHVPRIKLLKVPPQKYDFLSETETEQLLQEATGVWHDMILIAVKTGVRFGELIALKWEDINFSDQILTISRNIVKGIEGSPKNNRSRIVPLSRSIIEMLKSKTKTDSYLFQTDNRICLSYTTCRKKLHQICKRAGLRTINWHTLRHTFASHLAIKGASLISIKELLGHSDIKMTMRYAHINMPILKNAINMLEPPVGLNGTLTAQPHGRDSEFGDLLPLEFQNSSVKNQKPDINPVSEIGAGNGNRISKISSRKLE